MIMKKRKLLIYEELREYGFKSIARVIMCSWKETTIPGVKSCTEETCLQSGFELSFYIYIMERLIVVTLDDQDSVSSSKGETLRHVVVFHMHTVVFSILVLVYSYFYTFVL